MALLSDVSPITIALSAGVSVVTGYVGTLLNFRRQRDRARRTYGLAILAEIKTLQRVFRQYHGVLGPAPAEERVGRLPKLRLTTADLNVFGFNAGNIGLFSIRTAVEVIELYSRTRALIAQAQVLADCDASDPTLKQELFDHLKAVVVARYHSRMVARMLRDELPVLTEDRVRYFRRRTRIALRKARRRWVGPPPPEPAPPDPASVGARAGG